MIFRWLRRVERHLSVKFETNSQTHLLPVGRHACRWRYTINQKIAGHRTGQIGNVICKWDADLNNKRERQIVQTKKRIGNTNELYWLALGKWKNESYKTWKKYKIKV